MTYSSLRPTHCPLCTKVPHFHPPACFACCVSHCSLLTPFPPLQPASSMSMQSPYPPLMPLPPIFSIPSSAFLSQPACSATLQSPAHRVTLSLCQPAHSVTLQGQRAPSTHPGPHLHTLPLTPFGKAPNSPPQQSAQASAAAACCPQTLCIQLWCLRCTRTSLHLARPAHSSQR